MALRFASLGSGSRGNALLVEHRDTLIMIDCGLPLRVLEARLAAVGRSPRDIDAMLVTHEHADHSRSIGAFQRRYPVPLWTTPGTAAAIGRPPLLKSLSSHRELELGSITVEPFPVPHDAREPCQFAFRAGSRRLAVLTDTGHVTPTIRQRLEACQGIAVEFNHDLAMLESGSYPPAVKARVASRIGHLNNAQSAELIEGVGHRDLGWVAGLHISEQNNSEARVRSAVEPLVSAFALDFRIATQDAPLEWLVID